MGGVVIADPEAMVDDILDEALVGMASEGPGPVLPPKWGGAVGQLRRERSRERGPLSLESQELLGVWASKSRGIILVK